MILSQRETEILHNALAVFAIELTQEVFGEYTYQIEELTELESKILDNVGFTIKIK